MSAPDLRTLFEHQMWAFGRDVQSPYGNLLIHYGFVKSPAVVAGRSSLYLLDDVSLDSVGLQLGEVRLERGPICESSRLTPLLQWLLRYERWVEALAPGWRSISLSQRRRPACFSPHEMIDAYQRRVTTWLAS